jgi:BCCT family betaine/carnitine transporter
LFEVATRTFGTSVQVLVFGSSLAVLYLAFSKYGNIRLGAGKPEYSTATWVFMFICAGMGSSTLYWGVMEWAYYYQTPGLNIARSAQALEYSVSYSFFHWGISAWSIYALASLAMAYHFHVRKKSGLNLASIIEAVTGFKATGPVGRAVDLIFLLTMMGALTVSLALTASTLTRGLADLAGTPNTFTVQLLVIGAVAVLFSLSSYIGIDGGLQRLSKMVCVGALLFAAVVLLVGPTQFTLNNTANSIGLMLQHYVQMSLFTDPAGDGAFTRNWTVFYWLWWVSYAPGVAMFVARVSRGRLDQGSGVRPAAGRQLRLLVLLRRAGKLQHAPVHQRPDRRAQAAQHCRWRSGGDRPAAGPAVGHAVPGGVPVHHGGVLRLAHGRRRLRGGRHQHPQPA